MADNVTVDNGELTDYVVASEELTGGAQLQSVELHTESAGTKTKAGTSGNPLRVDPTGTTEQPTKETRAATGVLTSVAESASSQTILASNANRIKATIANDSSARLYLRFQAAAASATNYGVSLDQHDIWEETVYTGEIRGIWATDPGDGAARVTEFTT